MRLFGIQKTTGNNMGLLSADVPFAYSEAYKTLRTNLSFVSTTHQYKKIIVTSSIPNEGKSSVALDMAITLAESGAKVLVIDGDLRSPSIARHLRVRTGAVKGLSDILIGTAKSEECIITLKKFHVNVIVAGTIPPNPAELLGSPAMNALLTEMETVYDYIICDTPPATVVTDAVVLSRYCDGVILVVRQNYATRNQVYEAKANMESVGARIIGAVMNRYDLSNDLKDKKTKYYGHYESSL